MARRWPGGPAFLRELETFPKLRGRRGDGDAAHAHRSRICVRARRLSDEGLLLVGDDRLHDSPAGHLPGAAQRRSWPARSLEAAKSDLSATTLARYDQLYRGSFRGKRLIEMIPVGGAGRTLMDHFARPGAAQGDGRHHRAVTGDFLPPSAALRPGYLLRLIV